MPRPTAVVDSHVSINPVSINPLSNNRVNSPADSHFPSNRSLRNQEIADSLRRSTSSAESAELLNQLAEENISIADAIASRYASRGIAIEDLRQVARLALVRASRAFSPEREQDFLAYAVPCIRGELRRHFRDSGWMVRPPRRVQEAQYRIQSVRAELADKLGRDATPRELAMATDLDDKTVTEALTLDGCFHPESLDRKVAVEWGGEATIGDRLASAEGDLERCEARVMLQPLIAELPERDARVLQLRFIDGLTQREVGEAIGVTQMQVSRILTRVLRHLRAGLEGAGSPALTNQAA